MTDTDTTQENAEHQVSLSQQQYDNLIAALNQANEDRAKYFQQNPTVPSPLNPNPTFQPNPETGHYSEQAVPAPQPELIYRRNADGTFTQVTIQEAESSLPVYRTHCLTCGSTHYSRGQMVECIRCHTTNPRLLTSTQEPTE